MEAGREVKTETKDERLHQLALTMYRSGDSIAALKIWKRLKSNNPDFPDIDRWIRYASRPPYPATATKPQTDPSVFRTQRELMSRYGNTPRKRQFRPRTGSVKYTPRFRHRNVFYVFIIFGLLALFLSIRNNRSYLVQLNQVTMKLDCYQGMFFPYGWQKTRDMKIGIDPDWVDVMTNKELIDKLNKGISVHSLDNFDNLLIEIYMDLGESALTRMTVRGQQSAIYYFKKIEEADYAKLVESKLAVAFLNLSRLRFDDGDNEDALMYYEKARHYDRTHPGLFDIAEKLRQTPVKKETHL